ncbi:MAG: hypothetical protein ACRD0G_10945 [Acidimicrobiales bacterium]
MHDLVIRGGTVVDGSGAAKCTADVAVDDGRTRSVSSKRGSPAPTCSRPAPPDVWPLAKGAEEVYYFRK